MKKRIGALNGVDFCENNPRADCGEKVGFYSSRSAAHKQKVRKCRTETRLLVVVITVTLAAFVKKLITNTTRPKNCWIIPLDNV